MTREQRDQALFDRIAGQYAKKDSLPASSLARKGQLLAALHPLLAQRGSLGTVLDIGCGVGAPARYLGDHYQRYIGLDHSEKMVRSARLFNQGNPKATFIAGNVKSPGLEPKMADVILSIGALHHMTELDDVMASLARLARPGAFLVAIEPQNSNPLIQAARWARAKLDPTYSEEQLFFSESTLSALFLAHGLSNLSVSYEGYLSTPFAQVALPPQTVTTALSQTALEIDRWLHRTLPSSLQRLSFNLIVIGQFPKDKA